MIHLYLSRLLLNPSDARVRRDLGNIYELHRTVMSGFPETMPAGERPLFRLEEDRDERPLLLVQSRTEPRWDGLPAGYLMPASPFDPLANPAVKPIAPAFRPEQWLRFRLRANPTKKESREGRRQGRRVAIVREEAQLAWLGRKAEAGGFRFRLNDVRVNDAGREFGWTRKGPDLDRGHALELHIVQFEGILQVTDPDRFAATLNAGIGSAKGFGCGLLSLAPA